MLDGAVIIGTAAEAECDKLCVVTAPFEVSVERIAARDGISPEMAARRLNAQTPEAVLTARADYILPNTSTREALAKAANELCDALIGEGCCAWKTLFRLLRRLVVLVCIAAVLLMALPPLAREADRLLYPRKYSRQVEQWAAEYELDPLLVYAFIRTESGFDPAATSSVEARGLMQMTEETFLWMRSKIAPNEPLTFADLYSPDTAIRFGCYYLHLCMVRYKGDVSTAAAAYHSGWGTVDQLLQIEEHSADGETLQGFPYNQMHHYVNKITACYQTYQRLYAGQ